MRLLICEGRCNPRLALLDKVVTEYRHEERRQHVQEGLGVLPVPEDLVADLRRLVHCTHRPMGMNTWSCTVCGTERRF